MIRNKTTNNKKTKYRIVALVLLVSVVFTLFSCAPKEPDYKKGITITDEVKPYSEATNKRAGEVIFDLLSELLKTNLLPSISTATQSELKDISEDIRKLTVENPISEKQYNELLDVLENKRDLAIATLSSAFGKGDGGISIPETRELYLAIAEHTGASYVGALLYRLTLYSYELLYNRFMSLYEKYSTDEKHEGTAQVILMQAEDYRERRDSLLSGVGEENFALATRLSFMMADVFFGGGFEEFNIQSFSDSEILLFLKQVKFSSLTVKAEGWRLLISYFVPSRAESTKSAVSSMLYKADANGDLSDIADVFSDVVALLAFIQDNLDDADVAMMRKGDKESILSAAFSKFGETEWERIDRISKAELEKAEYYAVCEDFYGDDFKAYAESAEPVSLPELRSSVGSDGFTQKLEGYVAGISPAFSYWMQK